jgi:hypothetical protein
MLQQGLNFKSSFEDLIAVGDDVLQLKSIEDLCKENPEVADSTDINEEGATVPTMNNFGPIFLSGSL